MKVVSVTVSYKPNLEYLGFQLESLCTQVEKMLVVNNGVADQALQAICQKKGAKVINLGCNAGIGSAQNLGIQAAIEFGAEAILLMDQDSEPQANMVGHLRHHLHLNSKAAATGPSSVDLRTQMRSYFELDTGGWPRRWQPGGDLAGQTVEAAYLIASGSLLRVEAIKALGLMREDWFIDHVDTEWSLRARDRGWVMMGVADAKLGHRLGEKVSRVWFGRLRHVPHHSPERNYYMFRNALLLLREPFVAAHWRRYHLTRLAQLFLFFLAFAPQRWLRLRLMMRGLWDGLHGRTGPMS